tara:strand:+ start:21330 stop:21572 length:243 start_codon:yes stop_codon:yes gene_type:complete
MSEASTSSKNLQRAVFKKTLLMSGVTLLILGVYTLIQPSLLIDSLALEAEESNILSLALIVVGFSDVVAVIVLSRLRERK